MVESSPPALTPLSAPIHGIPAVMDEWLRGRWQHPARSHQRGLGGTKGLTRGSLLTLSNDLNQTERFCHPSR